jgi:hypothetical protein
VNGEVHGGWPRPTGAVVPRKKKVTKIKKQKILKMLKYTEY